jgi:hypothetical protein
MNMQAYLEEQDDGLLMRPAATQRDSCRCTSCESTSPANNRPV